MARYDNEFGYRPDRRRQPRRPGPRRRRRRPPGEPEFLPGPAYGEDLLLRSRFGMHDFAERYGRYSGGSPYDYEYSERTIQHAHPRPEQDIGFTRPLQEETRRRFPYQGRSPERRRRARRSW